jgi:homoserine O-acetyltransferase/O-succinyltransferase
VTGPPPVSLVPDERRDLWYESPTRSLGRAIQLPLPDGFTAERGGRLEAIQVAYESWGTLNEAGDNAILLSHTLTSDCHATGDFRDEPLGWWEPLIGPGRALDTGRWLVVCPNLLGSCFGTTGPRFPAPDGEPWHERFPLLTPRDLMRVQREFVRALGIRRLHLVLGASLGGMIAWEWAIEGGDLADTVAVVAAPLRTTAQQIGLNWLQRRGVEIDLGECPHHAGHGQAISRGVGMLSYRSPLGLEQRFGREWATPPGATLGERGLFNVESWLAHQGRKSARRFDPWSYVLLSRAMDLHDISRGRGSLVGALERVRCRTLVVGIGSDQLYPPAEVHLGADILQHLGKPVEYAELRSPHGHDAFLLETAQLAAILEGAGRRAPRPVVSAAERELRTVRLGVLGAGQVARSFTALLAERRDALALERGLRFELRAVSDLDARKLDDPVFGDAERVADPARLVAHREVDALLEVTRGGDTRALVETALLRGVPVATVNKALVERDGPALERLALAHGVRLAYHHAIAAGWALLYAVERPLARGAFDGIRSVLSATCNLVLERIEAGDSHEVALAYARALELTEPDPRLDVSGWDTAQKLLILATRTLGQRLGFEALMVRGIEGLDEALVRAAPRRQLRVKLVGLFQRVADGPPLAAVLPLAVPAGGHLGGLRGADNVIVLSGEETGELVHLGRGGGPLPVATALLNDLVGLFDPTASWTGRFPPAPFAPRAPEFALHLSRHGRGTRVTDRPAPGSVPLLESLILP